MNTTDTVKTIDKALLLAQMGASLAARWTAVNALLMKIQAENRQPTDEEMASFDADYDQMRAKLLGDADLIDKATDAGATQPG